MKIINNFGGIDKEIYNIGDILHKVGKNYSRALPIVCNENGEDFEDYRIYGNDGGVGDRTPNIFDSTKYQTITNNQKYNCTVTADDAGITLSATGADPYVGQVLSVGVDASSLSNIFMPCKAETTYTISASILPKCYVTYINESGISVGFNTITANATKFTFTTKPDTAYMFFRFGDGNAVAGDAIRIDKIVVAEGATSIPYGYEVSMNITGNIYNPEATDPNNGYMSGYYMQATGEPAANNSWHITEYISINPEKKYVVDYAQQGYYAGVAFYDLQKNYLSGQGYMGQKPFTLTVPQNAAYARFSIINPSYYQSPSIEESEIIPIYLGSSPLEKDEYIDYDSGKIYRMVNGVLTPTDPPVPLPSIPTINGKAIVSYAGAGTAPEKAWFSGMEFEIEDVYFGDKHIFSVWGEYNSTLPAQYSANGDYLADYRVYGTNGGVGDRTVNLFDYLDTDGRTNNKYINQSDGAENTDSAYYISSFIPVQSNAAYTWAFRVGTGMEHGAPTVGFYDSSKNKISVASHAAPIISFNFTTPQNCAYIRASVYKANENLAMLTEGSAAPAEYVPYGYVIPMSVSDGTTSTTTPIYIGSDPLGEDEYVDYAEGKIYRMSDGTLTPTDPPVPLPALPTVDGTTIVDYAGRSTAVPSRFVAKYRKEGF